MKKNKTKEYVVAILLVVFSVIAFVAPFKMNATFWIAYIFGVIAIALQLYVFKIAFTGEGDARSKFYGIPIIKIGAAYLIVQILVSFIEMTIAVPLWVSVIINIIVIAVAMIGCIAAETVRDEIERQDIQIKVDVNTMRSLQSMATSLVGQCSDLNLKSVIQNVADEFIFSDPVSSEQTASIEEDLIQQMNEIQNAVTDGNVEDATALCKQILVRLNERNRIAKLNK